ncbi:MAG: multicopper oxidase domain-containing protein [Anaerolineae bacterium]
MPASSTLGKALRLMLLMLLVGVSTMSLAPERQAQAASQTLPPHGLVCTTNSSATFTLNTRDGYISIPDGNTVYMWGYSEGGKPFQHPGPVLCVNQGDVVTIVLHNNLKESVSIIFPGQENVLANGMPAQPQFDANGVLTSLTNVAPANGGSATYSFVANQPGTYLYMSGTEPIKQVQMGLFGMLVVRPIMGANYAYNDPGSKFNPEAEYMVLLSEIDPLLHQAVAQGQPYNMNSYHPRYFMLNGRSFPDTIAANGANYLPSQPYGAFARIYPYDPISYPDPMLVRYGNVSSQAVAFHPHGNHGRVIARDGRVLVGPAAEDASFEKFTVPVGAGQTWDSLFTWTDSEQWDPVDNPIPVAIPQLQNLTFGTVFALYSGSPYLGKTDKLPVGTTTLNQCGEYYHIAHNHNLSQTTAWGVVMSGQITVTRIDPPLPNNCTP